MTEARKEQALEPPLEGESLEGLLCFRWRPLEIFRRGLRTLFLSPLGVSLEPDHAHLTLIFPNKAHRAGWRPEEALGGEMTSGP